MKLLAQLLALLGVERTDSDDADLTRALAAAEALKSRADTADQARADAEQAKAEAETKRDELQARVDAMEPELQAFKDAETARAGSEERSGLDAHREALKLDAVDDESSTDLRRRLAAHVAKSRNIEIRDDVSNAYLDALIDMGVADAQRWDSRAPYRGLEGGGQGGEPENREPRTDNFSTNDKYAKDAREAFQAARGAK